MPADCFQGVNTTGTPSKEAVLSTREFLRAALKVPPTSSAQSDLGYVVPAQSSSPAFVPTLQRTSFLVPPSLSDSSPEYFDLGQKIRVSTICPFGDVTLSNQGLHLLPPLQEKFASRKGSHRTGSPEIQALAYRVYI